MELLSLSEQKEMKNEINRLWNKSETETAGKEFVSHVISLLDQGKIRAAREVDGKWEAVEWVKKAIVLYFKIFSSRTISHGDFEFCDKIPLKTGYREAGVRVVPPATVRFGTFIGHNTILNPCHVNIGAYIGNNVRIDTWASIGSCTQIGDRVHIGSQTSIGTMVEPLQATPCVVEDGVWISPNCQIIEGVVIGRSSVLAMGCMISSVTLIYDAENERLLPRGHIPPYSICVPGSVPSEDGTHSEYAIIVKGKRESGSDPRAALNDVIRSQTIHR